MKIIADGVSYEFPEGKMTLGEQRAIHRDFGVNPAEGVDFSPSLVAAFLCVAIRRAEPHLPWKAAIAKVDAVTTIDFEEDEEPASEAGPTPAADAAPSTASTEADAAPAPPAPSGE